ncbi:MAG: cupin domain-containing protein [Phascolarctobacterium sp.]|nr:cupin domain-containing protein [Phascolarctobacterium sp.]
MESLIKNLISCYKLQPHPEGGYFAEVYTAADEKDNRPLAGSIYFLLNQEDISHFHSIDCEEIWYYHQGCGLSIKLINSSGQLVTKKLGVHAHLGEAPMVIIPKGSVFAAENLDKEGYTLVSCVTIPKFLYTGFKLFTYAEFVSRFPQLRDVDKKYFIDNI